MALCVGTGGAEGLALKGGSPLEAEASKNNAANKKHCVVPHRDFKGARHAGNEWPTY